MSDRKLATMMLNAVWNEDVRGLRRVLRMGADPNWIFNGYPILIHAVFTRNEKIMMLLIKAGAVQVEEALGFALDRCVGAVSYTHLDVYKRQAYLFYMLFKGESI